MAIIANLQIRLDRILGYINYYAIINNYNFQSNSPTEIPTINGTKDPTALPSNYPSIMPSINPTGAPTSELDKYLFSYSIEWIARTNYNTTYHSY